MSGIVGVVDSRRTPDPGLITLLTESIRYRGPDAISTWQDGVAALGHTMLRTTVEAAAEQQPRSLDGRTWISADCRVDDRDTLVRSLRSHGRTVDPEVTDPELILHAYAVWDRACVDHLLGDFAFGIWDSARKQLFCARDQLGLKLFHYAAGPGWLVFSNTLNCIRLHPAVTSRLDDVSVGDFLLFGRNLDSSRTCFADIHALPPGHQLLWRDGEFAVSRYWTLPVDPLLRYRKRGDYVEHFRELLQTAVNDRLRTDRVGLFLSGGLDSAGLAAMAALARDRDSRLFLQAHTAVYDRLIPDEERHYAGLVARHLNIPITFHCQDDYEVFGPSQPPAPVADPRYISIYGPDFPAGITGALGQHGRVALYGEGPDNALHYEWRNWAREELRNRRFAGMIRDVVAFPFQFREVPFLSRKRQSSRRRTGLPGENVFPRWLNPDFVKRLGLRERYENQQHATPDEISHPLRTIAYSSLTKNNGWLSLFEEHDAGVTRVNLEVRQPYLDIRMLRFFLSVPPIPWCRGKYLMRRGLSPLLPSETIARPKTPAQAFPMYVRWQATGQLPFTPSEAVSPYVETSELHRISTDSITAGLTDLRPKALDLFLQKT